jgi:predicted AAA+ superfamily ATPase
MLQVSDREIENRLRLDNPWWAADGRVEPEIDEFPRRAYLAPFMQLVGLKNVRRAVVLMGPRRVGKTILVYHAIQKLMDEGGVSGRDILYVSLETPIYTGLSIDEMLKRFRGAFARGAGTRLYVFLDEIQYLHEWEIHLKSLVDTHRDVCFVATGSAAAALRTRSAESGAGRFTEFRLPPLTFAEYLRFIGREDTLIREIESGAGPRVYEALDLAALNVEFINYLNFGGFPEAVFSGPIQANPRRYIKSDIIDKVLLRDLPSLYGISDIQELNSLFNTLAYNTGRELALEDLSKTSHVAKNTLQRYLEYLEAAFLIRRMRRVDDNARHFQRMTTFKVYLTNPAMRAALFGPVTETHEAIGQQAETAVLSQWLHNTPYVDSLHYARWKKGEIDFISLDPARQKPRFAVEVKWSDRVREDPRELAGLIEFCGKHALQRRPLVTTRSFSGVETIRGVEIEFSPCSLHCYTVGKNTLEGRR